MYWLDPVSNGGHVLGPHVLQVQRRVRNAADTRWEPWTEWVQFSAVAGNVLVATGAETLAVTVGAGPTGGVTDLTPDVDTGVIDQLAGTTAYNLMITGAMKGQYKFRIKAKQSGDALKGLNLESGWVNFNRSPSAGLGYVTIPVPNPVDVEGVDDDGTEIPLMPALTAKALAADAVKDQGIGLTWKPSVGTTDTRVGFQDHDNDGDDAQDVSPEQNDDGPTPSDYRIDVSKDGVKWERGQTRTVSLRKWDHEDLKSTDVRFYRLFPINHGQFGQADIAAAKARKAVIASPDTALNLRQESATTTSITMEWDNISAAAKYDLSYAKVDEDNNDLPGTWVSLKSGITDTSYTDTKDLLPGQSRWYRVVALDDEGDPVPGADGAEALGETEDAGEPGTPVGLVAQEAFDSSLTNSDDRGVLLLWDQPTESGKDPHTSYTVERKLDDGAWETLVTDTANLEDQTALSTHFHDEDELSSDEQRAYRVAALSGSGVGPWSNVSYYPPMAGMAMPGMPGNAMSLMAGPPDDNDPAAIKLTWDAGANATTHTVAGVLRNADGTFDTSTAIWMTDVTSPLIVEMDDRPEGTYIFGVVAGLIDGTDREWSDWARATVAYPQ